jgi:hypothetical protein
LDIHFSHKFKGHTFAVKPFKVITQPQRLQLPFSFLKSSFVKFLQDKQILKFFILSSSKVEFFTKELNYLIKIATPVTLLFELAPEIQPAAKAGLPQSIVPLPLPA